MNQMKKATRMTIVILQNPMKNILLKLKTTQAAGPLLRNGRDVEIGEVDNVVTQKYINDNFD